MVKPKYGSGAVSALSQGLAMPSNQAMMSFQGDLARAGSAELKTSQELAELNSRTAILTDRNSGVFKLVGDEYELRDDWLEQNNKLSGNATFGEALGMNKLGGGYYKRGIRGNPKKVTNRAVFAPTAAKQGVVPISLLDKIEAAPDEETKKALEAQANKYKTGELTAYVTGAINADRKFALLNRFGTDSPDDVPLAFSEEEITAMYRSAVNKLNMDRKRLKPFDSMDADLRANTGDQPLLASRGVGVEGYTTQGVGDTVTPESDLKNTENELTDMIYDSETGRSETLMGLEQLKQIYAQNPLVTTPAPYEEEYQETITDPKAQEGVDFNDEKARIFKEINSERSSNKTRFPLLKNAGKLEQLLPSLTSIQEGDLKNMPYATSTGLYNFWKSKTGNEGKTRIGNEWKSVMNNPEELKALATEYETGIKQQISNAGYDLRYLEDYQQGDATTTGGTTTVTKTRTVTPDPITTTFEDAYPELTGLTGEALDNAVQGLIEQGRFDEVLSDAQKQSIMDGFAEEGVNNLSEFATNEESKPDFDPAKSYNKLYIAYSMMATNGVLPNGQTVKQATDIAYQEYFTGGTVSVNKSTGALEGDTIENIADRRVDTFDSNTDRMTAETDRLTLLLDYQEKVAERYRKSAAAVQKRIDEGANTFRTRVETELLPKFDGYLAEITKGIRGEGEVNYNTIQGFETSLNSIANDFYNNQLENDPQAVAEAQEKWNTLYATPEGADSKTAEQYEKFRNRFDPYIYATMFAQPEKFTELNYVKDTVPAYKIYESLKTNPFWIPFITNGRLMDYLGDFPAADVNPASYINNLYNRLRIRYVNGKPVEFVATDMNGVELEASEDLAKIIESNALGPAELQYLIENLQHSTNSTYGDGPIKAEDNKQQEAAPKSETELKNEFLASAGISS